MNPELTFEVQNLLEGAIDGSYDVIAAIELLEYIEPERCEAFVETMRDGLTEKGRLVLTLPHANKTVGEKHYQHFEGADLRALLEPRFAEVELVPFDRRSLLLEGMKALLGWRGEQFIINALLVLNRIRWFHERWCRYSATEGICRRIAAVALAPIDR